MSRLRAAFLDAPGGPARRVADFRTLGNEGEIFRSLHALIRDAHTQIEARFYRVWPDATGSAFLEALTKAAQRGVRVRLILDGFGSLGIGDAIDPLRDAGGQVEFFNPLSGLGDVDVNIRDHAKLVVVDGHEAWVCSANIADTYADHWHDAGLWLSGPLAPLLDDEVEEVWDGGRAGVIPNPILGESGGSKDPGEHPTIGRLVNNGYGGWDVRPHVMAMIESAERRVDVSHCYMTDSEVVSLLAQRAQDGLRVTVVAPASSDVPVVDLIMGRDVTELLDAGVHYHHLPFMSHRKFMAVDHTWLLFGSTNLDARSFEMQLEVDVALFTPSLGRKAVRELVVKDLLYTTRLREDPIPWWKEPRALLVEVARAWL